MCTITCGVGKKANSNLGYLLGYRNTKYEWSIKLGEITYEKILQTFDDISSH